MHLFSTGISGITGTRRTRTDGCAHVRLGIFLVQSSRTSTGELKPALPTDVYVTSGFRPFCPPSSRWPYRGDAAA